MEEYVPLAKGTMSRLERELSKINSNIRLASGKLNSNYIFISFSSFFIINFKIYYNFY